MSLIPKKLSNSDVNITIRILKALGKHKPFGIFRQFTMIQILRGLKQPNVISSEDIWKFLFSRYDKIKYDELHNSRYKLRSYIPNDRE